MLTEHEKGENHVHFLTIQYTISRIVINELNCSRNDKDRNEKLNDSITQ